MTADSGSFLYCRQPGAKAFTRYDFTSAEGGVLNFGVASVRPWPGTSLSEMYVRSQSTPKDEYIDGVTDLIEELRFSGGKTVVCRQICGNGRVNGILDSAEKYFARFPDMFCFIFYHPVTKWWMGASPELLLESGSERDAATRALAGTRRAGVSVPWSRKNIEEHRFVVDDMLARLASVEPAPEIDVRPSENLRYGSIEHLCTPVRLSSSGILPFDRIIEAIHPTAAVCGYPREDAVRRITAVETWPRNCYGGYIVVPSPQGRIAYVILRCIHFDETKWAIYTGSGITGDSCAADEWDETQAKAEPLVELAMRASSLSSVV